MLKSPPLVATLSDSMRMSPCSWGDIFTWPLRGDRIIGLRHRWVGRLDTTLIFCYIVAVEKCVQKAGDPSRFFYFRHLLIGFRGYVEGRHRRARPTTPSNSKIGIPTLGMRSCAAWGGGIFF